VHIREIVIICVYFTPFHPLLFYFLAHLHSGHRLTDFRDLWHKDVIPRNLRPFRGASKS